MTEPDEALLWAREQCATDCDERGFSHVAERYRRGAYDNLFEGDARAYRAGAAASAERIKELEEGLSMLYDLFIYVKPSAFRNGITDSTDTIDEGEVKAGLILDHAKALLKEPDQ